MVNKRGALEGVGNVVRFNWPFFVFAFGVICLLLSLMFVVSTNLRIMVLLLLLSTCYGIVSSLIVSFWVYDASPLYKFTWLPLKKVPQNVLNLNAGFDETSSLLKDQFPNARFIIGDIYNQELNSEPSIRRAQKRYPKPAETLKLDAQQLGFQNETFDAIFAILVLHEIRGAEERGIALLELKRVLKKDGVIVVTEHLRDFPNFLAYTFGLLHFFSRKTWINDFKKANLTVEEEIRITPFVRSFILSHGNPS